MPQFVAPLLPFPISHSRIGSVPIGQENATVLRRKPYGDRKVVLRSQLFPEGRVRFEWVSKPLFLRSSTRRRLNGNRPWRKEVLHVCLRDMTLGIPRGDNADEPILVRPLQNQSPRIQMTDLRLRDTTI